MDQIIIDSVAGLDAGAVSITGTTSADKVYQLVDGELNEAMVDAISITGGAELSVGADIVAAEKITQTRVDDSKTVSVDITSDISFSGAVSFPC